MSSSSADPRFAHTHLDTKLHSIPLSVAMQVNVHDYDGERLTLTAPLAPNSNDKGCAFGGSLASLLTLAGWGLIELRLAALGRVCDIYVQDSTIRYLAPIWGPLSARAELATGESWDTFFVTLANRGRARLRVICHAPLDDGSDACALDSRFVAIARAPGDAN